MGNVPQKWNTGMKGVLNGLEMNLSGTHLGFAFQNTSMPQDAYMTNAGNFSSVRISNINPEAPNHKYQLLNDY
ncbi:MAG: hypothetical protein WC220_02130 [Pedobacter sp.]|jgi:hypothetical protein